MEALLKKISEYHELETLIPREIEKYMKSIHQETIVNFTQVQEILDKILIESVLLYDLNISAHIIRDYFNQAWDFETFLSFVLEFVKCVLGHPNMELKGKIDTTYSKDLHFLHYTFLKHFKSPLLTCDPKYLYYAYDGPLICLVQILNSLSNDDFNPLVFDLKVEFQNEYKGWWSNDLFKNVFHELEGLHLWINDVEYKFSSVDYIWDRNFYEKDRIAMYFDFYALDSYFSSSDDDNTDDDENE